MVFLRFMSGAEPPCRWQDCYFFKTIEIPYDRRFIGNLDGLEEINILPSAWRLRTRHESQKNTKRRHVAGSHSVLALFLSLIPQARKIRARPNPKSNFDDRSEPWRSQVFVERPSRFLRNCQQACMAMGDGSKLIKTIFI